MITRTSKCETYQPINVINKGGKCRVMQTSNANIIKQKELIQ